MRTCNKGERVLARNFHFLVPSVVAVHQTDAYSSIGSTDGRTGSKKCHLQIRASATKGKLEEMMSLPIDLKAHSIRQPDSKRNVGICIRDPPQKISLTPLPFIFNHTNAGSEK